MTMNYQLQIFLLSISLFSATTTSASKNVSFTFPSFNSPSLQSLTLLGDAYLKNGLIGLTRETGVPSSGAGSIIYTNPIVFHEPHTNATASFSTKFTFSVTNANPASSSGDGLTFFLSPDNDTLGSPGSFLGLVNGTRFVAVEFDTKLDSIFSDPSDNHVGLDIDTLHSVKTADPTMNLKNGDAITAWIDYKSDLHRLSVFLSSYSTIKPTTPLLSVDVNLAGHLDKPMYPGFSASTEGSTELHTIESWSFQTFMFLLPESNEPNDDSSIIINPPPPISVPESNNGRHKRLGMGLGIAGPAFFCAALIVFGYMSVRKWKRLKMEKSFKAELVTGPKEFDYKELKKSTKGFHPSRILGMGAFGTVYKATLYSGSTAAVKRSKHSHEGKTEFLAELSIIACLRHKNLVPLQGWCVEKGELLLVYDYMLNGSLDKVLYQDNNGERSVLSWTHRQNIVVGLASVLTYLHQECEQQVIHRDIKTSNIMLDSGFNPRLGDFGLARLMEHDKSPVSTLTAGTMGYLAPEYLQYGKANEKTDAFSYGVVILEVACGRRPIEKEQQGQGGNTTSKMVNLVDWVWGLYSEGKVIEAADKRLNGEFSVEEMNKLLLLGLSCANPDSAERPSMRKALQVLINESDLPRVPRVKPSLSFSSRLPFALEDIVSEDESSTLSPPGLTQIRVE